MAVAIGAFGLTAPLVYYSGKVIVNRVDVAGVRDRIESIFEDNVGYLIPVMAGFVSLKLKDNSLDPVLFVYSGIGLALFCIFNERPYSTLAKCTVAFVAGMVIRVWLEYRCGI